MTKAVWIGLIGVTPRRGNELLEGGRAAYVNALALAANVGDYSVQVREALDLLGFDVFEMEDVEPFRTRASEYTVETNLRELAMEVEVEGGVQFGTFHTSLGPDS